MEEESSTPQMIPSRCFRDQFDSIRGAEFDTTDDSFLDAVTDVRWVFHGHGAVIPKCWFLPAYARNSDRDANSTASGQSTSVPGWLVDWLVGWLVCEKFVELRGRGLPGSVCRLNCNVCMFESLPVLTEDRIG